MRVLGNREACHDVQSLVRALVLSITVKPCETPCACAGPPATTAVCYNSLPPPSRRLSAPQTSGGPLARAVALSARQRRITASPGSAYFPAANVIP
ncbi:hypothetical protein A0H81_07886 [Grifola frondosa]|uniref:Uncharacterized protein n=1 Tax=Grifola frondosa TaxID=5627 RepID=A0A1C7M6T1_GRIFR|nr:hypothetical protein A0H81_07886 [Grifola frondosa]